MNIAIIDDERPARSELKYLLSQVLPEAEFFEADGVKTADELVKNHEFQASAIREQQKKAAIVFVTAYQEYAVKAFELGAVDYILKPYDLDRIKKTLQRLEEQGYFSEERESGKYEELDKLAVNAGDKIRLIDYRDIIYIEYNQRNSLIHTADTVYTENYTMAALTEKLEKKNFFRIHKSYLVNLEYIEELVPNINSGYEVRLRHCPDQLLPVSRSQIRHLKQLFNI